MDWYRWHQGYQPGGSLQQRLHIVRRQLRQAISAAPPGPIQIISICAGQGHDIVGAVAGSPRQADVRALLVELDERNVEEARKQISAAGLCRVEVVCGDAGVSDAYLSVAPAQIVLLCGVFGSLTDADVESTVAAASRMCAARGQVVWTAHRDAPGLFQAAEAAFHRHGFAQLWTDPDDRFGVARHQHVDEPGALEPGQRFFSFADEHTLTNLGRSKPPGSQT